MPKRKGNKIVYSSQEATEMIFMNSDSEGDDVDLGEHICDDIEESSHWEPDQEDTDSPSEDELPSAKIPSKRKKGIYHIITIKRFEYQRRY